MVCLNPLGPFFFGSGWVGALIVTVVLVPAPGVDWVPLMGGGVSSGVEIVTGIATDAGGANGSSSIGDDGETASDAG